MSDKNSLANSYLSVRDHLARIVANIVPPGDVEDVVQETYVRVCRAASSIEIRSPRSFMRRTALNLALDHVKRAEYRLGDDFDERHEQISEQGSSATRDTLDQVCAFEEFSIFCAAVRELPTQCRQVFVLKKVYGYTQREISQELSISEKTVEGHIANGITRCKQWIMKRNDEHTRPNRQRKHSTGSFSEGDGK